MKIIWNLNLFEHTKNMISSITLLEQLELQVIEQVLINKLNIKNRWEKNWHEQLNSQ